MSVISNTTVLSNFASINQLDLLHRLYGTPYISTEKIDGPCWEWKLGGVWYCASQVGERM